LRRDPEGMPKSKTFEDLSLEPYQDDRELWRWLYQQLRMAILDGRLRAGTRLPSTRDFADQYGVSRGTVVAAFDQLQAEGYTSVEPGSGTYVESDLPSQLEVQNAAKAKRLASAREHVKLSKLVARTIANVEMMPASRSVGRAFRSWEPAIDIFPVELWAKVATRVMRRAPRSLYGQGESLGYRPLRVAIAEYIGSARGVLCSPDQVLITTGAQQGLDLMSRLLLDPGDLVWVEDPGYHLAKHAFQAVGAKIVPIRVDRQGIDVGVGIKAAPNAKLAYVSPANQFPLGVTMSAERRLALLNWAQSSGAWIIEDEYDAEYRYGGRPVASLQSLDRQSAVIYIGTFTKMLFNAIRIGFVVLPEALIEPTAKLRMILDRQSATLDQAILAEFMTEGHFGQHVRKMRGIYAERLAVLREASEKHLTGLLTVEDAVAGMRTVGWLQPDNSDEDVASRARSAGLNLFSVSNFTMKFRQPPALILGFAGCEAKELQRGVSVLASVLRKSK